MTDMVTMTYLTQDDEERTVTVPAKHFQEEPHYVAYYQEGQGMRGVVSERVVGLVKWEKQP